MKSIKSLFLLTFLISLHPFGFSATPFQSLEKLEQEGAHVSALVMKLNDGKVIAELNADKRLSPASVTKLAIASQALDFWGPEKTFVTKLYMRGSLDKENSVLNGDLIFYGSGDPTLTNEKLWFLTTDVARLGIKKITGKIIVNNSYFGKIKNDDSRNEGKIKSYNAYDAPLSSSAVNFSVLALVMSPNQQTDKPAKIAIEPYPLKSIIIKGNVITTKANSAFQASVTRNTQNGKDIYTVSGQIPYNGATQRIYRSVSDPDRYAGETIQAFINSAGIETSGLIAVESTSLSSDDKVIAEVDGFPLSWQLRGLFQVSNNFIADMLALGLLNEINLKKKGNLIEGGKIIENYLQNVIKNSPWNSIKKNNTPIVLESGSGLTPNNRLSARDIISVLDQMYFSGTGFPAYLAALPIIGEEGTLKKRFSLPFQKHLQGRLRAKTGTLTEPVHVSSLSGYSRLRNGDWVSFAIIVNGIKSKTKIDQKLIRDAIDSDLAKILPAEL